MPDSQPAAINRQTIKSLARLAQLSLSPDEETSYQRDLAAIVEFVNQLEKADVSGCQPLHQVTGLASCWRDDQQGPAAPKQHPDSAKLLSFWPNRLADGQFKAPRPPAGAAAAGN